MENYGEVQGYEATVQLQTQHGPITQAGGALTSSSLVPPQKLVPPA